MIRCAVCKRARAQAYVSDGTGKPGLVCHTCYQMAGRPESVPHDRQCLPGIENRDLYKRPGGER